MTQRFDPHDDPSSESFYVSVPRTEYRKLRELRATCLDAPLELNRTAEKLRGVMGFTERAALSPLAVDLQQYGLRLKNMAEEAR